jgi:hypothetical protein
VPRENTPTHTQDAQEEQNPQDQVHQLLTHTQQSWRKAKTRDYLLQLTGMAIDLIKYQPDLGMPLVDGITWVDNFLQPGE